MYTVIAILIVVCIVSFTGTTIVTGPEGKFGKIYCYLFEHKDWQKWEKVCQVLPELELSEHRVFDECEKLNSYEFLLPNIGISDKDLVVVYWETINEVSVHEVGSGKCILCPFDRYHSSKAVEILKQRI